MSELRVGTSGWQYKHWKGRFYPKELPTSKWLHYYPRFFATVELNNPFYRQPERKTFEKWRRAVPDDFVYAVKLNRFITHIKRLGVERDSIERSYGTMTGLGPKLAVVLVQLPPRMKFDEDRADRFFSLVAPRRRRHALEPRDASWFTEESARAPAPAQGRSRHRRDGALADARRRDRRLRLPALSWPRASLRLR